MANVYPYPSRQGETGVGGGEGTATSTLASI